MAWRGPFVPLVEQTSCSISSIEAPAGWRWGRATTERHPNTFTLPPPGRACSFWALPFPYTLAKTPSDRIPRHFHKRQLTAYATYHNTTVGDAKTYI